MNGRPTDPYVTLNLFSLQTSTFISKNKSSKVTNNRIYLPCTMSDYVIILG